jgi:hypothetical protein
MRLVVSCLACPSALALVNYKKEWLFAFQILANALVCGLPPLACNNSLASIAPPSDVTGLGIFVSLFGELSTFVYMVRESSYAAVEVATHSGSSNIMGGMRAVAGLAFWWVHICNAWSYTMAMDYPATNCRCRRCHWGQCNCHGCGSSNC